MLGLLAGVAWLPVCLAAAEFAARARPARTAAGRAAARGRRWPARSSPARSSSPPSRRSRRDSGCCVRAGRRGVLLALAGGRARPCCSRPSRCCRASSCSATRPRPRGSPIRAASARSCATTCARSSGRYGVSRSELTTLYAGAATPALALFALLALRRRALPLVALVAFAIVWASGLAGWLLGPLPLLKSLATHEPVRAMAVAVLAARGPGGARAVAPHAAARARRRCWRSACSVTPRARRRGRPQGVVPAAARRDRRVPAGARRRGAPPSRSPRSPSCSRSRSISPGTPTTRIVRSAGSSASSIFPAPAPSAPLPARAPGAGGPVPLRHLGTADRCCSISSASAGQRGRAGPAARLRVGPRSGSRTSRGTTPCTSRRYNRYLLASNGGRQVDRHFEYVAARADARGCARSASATTSRRPVSSRRACRSCTATSAR